MENNRRDIFKKIGMLGATALGFAGIAKRAKAAAGNPQNPLLGLWDMTIPGSPTIYFKYAISEGAYVCTGNTDFSTSIFPNKYSPTMGTYIQTGPLSYRLRERSWALDPNGDFAGYTDFTGSAVFAENNLNRWSGSGTFNQYDTKGKLISSIANFPYSSVRFSA